MPIKSCKVVDKYTVVMTWEKAYAYYNSLFEAILPKHVLEGKDVVTFDGYNRSPLGTGPFKFVEWKSGEYVKVERNPDYWRGTDYPYLDGIVFTFIPDDNTRLNAMKAKEHDLGQITPTQVKEVQGLAGYKVNLVDQNSWNHFDFSVKTENGKALFSDVKARQAIAYAIDRKAIAEDLMEGTVKVADSPVQTNSPYFNPDTPVYTFDPEKARSLLDEAGWKPGSDGIREKDGVKFSFTIMNRSGRVDRIAIAQVIQAQLKDIGIDVKMETKESAAWTKQWRSGEWEAVVGGWMLPADPSVTNQYACKGSNNMTGLCSEELDKLMYASDQELDFAKRKPLIDQVQVKLAEEMLSLPIYYNVVPEVVSEKLGNFKGSGTNLGSFWNVYEWYLAK
jgi:peptide/nickel transport system substrate-binding protein